MGVHVSIHDVSPAWAREVDVALELCHAAGAKPALLVVPNFHGQAPLTDAPAYVDRLRALAASGHEILLHGYYHQSGVAPLAEERSGAHAAPRGLRRLFAQKIVSASEAEFSDVGEAEARRRIEDGKRVLDDAGLPARGFVPPAWSMPPWMLDVLASQGFAFTEDHLHVYSPAQRTKRASLVLNYASRTPSRLFSSVAWVRASRPIERVWPARIALHPGDMRARFLRSESIDLLAWGRRRGFLPTVASLLEASPAGAAISA
jgi:predicted deacetylase